MQVRRNHEIVKALADAMLSENRLDPWARHVAKENERVVACEILEDIDVFVGKLGVEPRFLDVLTTRLVGRLGERREEFDVLRGTLNEAVTKGEVGEPSRIGVGFGIDSQNVNVFAFVTVLDDDTAVIDDEMHWILLVFPDSHQSVELIPYVGCHGSGQQ